MRRHAAIILCLWIFLGQPAHAEEDLPIERRRLDQLRKQDISNAGAAALDSPGLTWEHHESAHFVFHTETGFAVTQLANLAERAYAMVKQDLGVTEDRFERKCQIYVFLTPAAWRTFTKHARMDPWTGGWCNGRELFLLSRIHFTFQGTTLPHEITHLVVHRFLSGDVPLWLSEGFAEFEGTRFFRGYLKARDRTLVGVADRLPAERYIPLEKLTRALDYPRTQEEVEAFYIESHRLVGFLYYECGGLEPLQRFMKRLAQGALFETAWPEVYGQNFPDIAALEKAFRPYLTKSQQAN